MVRNHEAQAFEMLRKATEGQARPDGLEAFVIARRILQGRLELIAITSWRDLESMTAVMGPDWETPSWLPGLDQIVEDATVEHFETVAESFHGLAGLTPDTVDLLAPTALD